MVNIIDSFKGLKLYDAPADITATVLTTFSRLEELTIYTCPLVSAHVRFIFSLSSLRKLSIRGCAFPDPESIDALCLGMESTKSLESLSFNGLSILPQHEEQLATALARCNTLVDFLCDGGRRSLRDHYFVALSNSIDTKLERVLLIGVQRELDLHGDQYLGNTSGPDTAIAAKIRNLLKLNVQRKTCPPLFAAIGNAETDATRKQCLLEALNAVDLPVLYEFISVNQGNMIELIQRLGREDLPLGPIILPINLDRDNESMAVPAPLNGMNRRTTTSEEQIADLRRQLDVSNSRIIALEEEKADLGRQLDVSDSRIITLEEQNADLRCQLEESQAMLREARLRDARVLNHITAALGEF